jgi:uncharacterized protein
VIHDYEWAAAQRFVGRTEELQRLERWWASNPHSSGITLFGRRRVGKSWLFRRFAHGKPAVLLVATAATPAQQYALLAEQLEPHLGVRPQLSNLDDLFRIVFQLGERQRVLVVIDELPYLLGFGSTTIRSNLTILQSAIEKYRDDSLTKLLICGSAIAQMEEIQNERSPLHGRFQALELRPMTFNEARPLMGDEEVIDQFIRFSITGGMPAYIELLREEPLQDVLTSAIVERNAPLFNEPETILATELSQPGNYMGILSALTLHSASSQDLRSATGLDATTLQPYLQRLEAMHLIRASHPIGAPANGRKTKWECSDHFVRFWFRFVMPFQFDLQAGSSAGEHVRRYVLPFVNEHTSIVFEEEFRRWIRSTYPSASQVGGWWGRAHDTARKAGLRTSEEIDAVGIHGQQVVLVGEAKWRNRPTDLDTLENLVHHKIPALAQGGLKISTDLKMVICSRGGFSPALQRTAANSPTVDLVPASEVLQHDPLRFANHNSLEILNELREERFPL